MEVDHFVRLALPNVDVVYSVRMTIEVNAVNIGQLPGTTCHRARGVLVLRSPDAVQHEIGRALDGFGPLLGGDERERAVEQQRGPAVYRRPGRYLGACPPARIKHAMLDKLVEH